MWLWSWVYERVFYCSFALLVSFGLTLVWLAVGCWLSFTFKHSGYALAFSLLALGVNLIVLFSVNVFMQNVMLYLATLLCGCGTFYGVALFAVTARASVAQRMAEQAKIERATYYTLPARDNGFVRERLHTVLNESSELGENVAISFGFVRRMATQLKNEKLSLTESLEIEELSKLLALYMKKETFTTEDVNALNDGFSRVLKLCAKYGVSVR